MIMKVRILDTQVKVYGSMDESEVSIASLSRGMEVEIGGGKRKQGKVWVPVTLEGGQKGYISGEARIYAIKEGALMQDSVDMYEEASVESPVKEQLKRNDRLAVLEVSKDGEVRWARVRDINGNEGYISGETRLRLIQVKTKATGRKNMLTGVMWLIVGGFITFSGSSITSGGSFALLGYGALLFGGVMLIMGLVQYFTAPA
jgi:hypothetical protein